MKKRALALGAVLFLILGVFVADAQRRGRIRRLTLADTIRANIYADNWFQMYINGELIAVDSIAFMPHNAISVDILPKYPMVIAVMAKDFADPETGLEYNNTRIGDGGFILKFGDGTVTNGGWKAKKLSWGPLNGDIQNPKVVHQPVPENWYAVDFDDTSWGNATVFSVEEVRPMQPYRDHDFAGAEFIWTEDLELDNTILFRFRVEKRGSGARD